MVWKWIPINEFQEIIQNDPIIFLDSVLWGWHWSTQDEIILSVFKNQRTTVKSCHGVWKSAIAARIILAFLFTYPDSVIVTTAPTFRQVENILWREIRQAIKRAKIPLWWNILKVKYEIDEKRYALWLSSDKEDNFQGFHARHLLVVADEAGWIKESTLKVMEALLTSQWTRILYIWNPTQASWGFYESHKSDQYNKISISCFQTPNFTKNKIKNVDDIKKLSKEEIEKLPLVYPELITPLWVFDRMRDWGEDSPMFQSRVLSIFPEEGEDTLIKLSHIEKALLKEWSKEDWKMRPRKKCIWIDVARFGSDTTVLIWMDNWKMHDKIIFYKWKDTMTTVGKAIRFFNELWYKKEFEYFVVDDTGVWWGVTDRLMELWYNVLPVNNASSPSNKEIFRDIKGEIYWMLRQAFLDWNIRIYDVDRLIKDISSIKYDYTIWQQKIFIKSKKNMKKEGLDSPDFADALALAYYWCTVWDSWDSIIEDEEGNDTTVVWDVRNKKF